jgi:hypothetical protein
MSKATSGVQFQCYNITGLIMRKQILKEVWNPRHGKLLQWALASNGDIWMFSSTAVSTGAMERTTTKSLVLSVSLLAVKSAEAVSIDLSIAGIHIHIDTSNDIAAKEIERQVNAIDSSFSEMTQLEGQTLQPMKAMLNNLKGHGIFLPIMSFFMPSPKEFETCAILGQDWCQCVSDIQRAFNVQSSACLVLSPAIAVPHRVFICSLMLGLISKSLGSVNTTQNVAPFVGSTSSLALASFSETEIDRKTFDTRNDVTCGRYTENGQEYPCYPMSWQMIGNYRRRLASLIQISMRQMRQPDYNKRSREESESHIQSQMDSLVQTQTWGDAGIFVQSVDSAGT